MKRFFISLFLLCLIANSLFATPFWVRGDDPQVVKKGPLMRIMAQEPVTFSIASDNEEGYPVAPLADYVQRAAVFWFESLEQALSKPEAQAQREVLKRYKEAISFGSKMDSFVLTNPAEANINIYVTEDSIVQEQCHHPKATGCVKPKGEELSKIIYLTYSSIPQARGNPLYFPLARTVIHEIGHTWGLDDLYLDFYGKPRRYGSGIQESIMYLERVRLTCDDLDGVSNMMYFAAKATNPEEPDFIFPSFCDATRIYKNGKIHKPGFQLAKNKTHLEYTYYCANAKKAFTVTVHPLDFNNLLSREDFETCKEGMPDIIAQDTYRELTSEEALELTNSAMLPSDEKIFYTPLITAEYPLDLFIHIGGKVPVYAYILDKDKQLIFLFAHLKQGKNWVYNHLFDENKPVSSSYKQLMVYRRDNPAEYFHWFEKHIRRRMSFTEANEFMNDSVNTLVYLQQYLPLFRPYTDDIFWEENAIEAVSSWDRYLTDEFLQNTTLEQQLKEQLLKSLQK